MDRIIEIKVNGNYINKDNKNAGVKGEANATKLRITFDEGWRGYAKRVTFWDALGKNPTKIILENIDEQDVAIPGEAMMETGMLTFVIDGFLGDKRQRSVSDKLFVKDAPMDDNAGEPAETTPPLTAQLQKEIQDNKDEISKTNNRLDDVEANFNESVDAIESEVETNQRNTTDNFAKVNETIEQLKNNKADLVNGKVPASQLPGFVDDVIEGKLISISGVTVFSVEGTPVTPENGKIYVDTLTNKQFRWSGTQYIEISESLALGETESTAYSGAKGKKNAEDIEGLKANKVDKEDDKGLSTNDYTTAEKNKLAGLENYVLPSDVVKDAKYVHTDNNYTSEEKAKLEELKKETDKVQDTLKNKVVDYMGRITYDDMFLQYRGKDYNDGYNYVGIFSTGEWNLDEIGIFESYNVADLDMQRKTVFTSEGMKVYQREADVSRAFGEWELVYESANSGGADMETIKQYVDEQIGLALEGDY